MKPVKKSLNIKPMDKKINEAKELAQTLNGLNQQNFKLITLTCQDLDVVKFSESCEQLLNTFPNEAIVNYSVNTSIVNTNGVHTILFMAVIQFYDDGESHKKWIESIRLNNLIIK